MGLMYIFPVTDDPTEGDRIDIQSIGSIKMLTLKTYGLPMIFWGYLLSAFSVIALMWLASRDVISKLLTYEDPTLLFLGHLVQLTLILTPIVLLCFFFYEKNIIKFNDVLIMRYKLFFIPFWQNKIKLKSADALMVEHFMDSPNMAKIKNQFEDNKEALKHFENRGYFELKAETATKKISIDRHSRKADLLKMRDLLIKY